MVFFIFHIYQKYKQKRRCDPPHNCAAMHPVEAVSILSQLAYVQPGTATSFANQYAWQVGFSNLPIHAPVVPYTPLYNEFTYASNFRLEPNTPNKDVYRYMQTNPQNNGYYRPELVGRQTSYDRTLFHMTRDMAVLEALDKVKPTTGFYCVRNEDPIESKLSEAAFKVEFNVNTVYPCTGPVHDAHVPKCVCPVPPPPVRLTALAERIKAHRAAAPFATRLRDLYAAVADAHKAAATLETNQFPLGTLLANFTSSKSIEANTKQYLNIGRNDDDYYKDYYDSPDSLSARGKAKLESVSPQTRAYIHQAIALIQDNFKRAAAARTAADAAEAELAAYIAAKEDAAFTLFKPEIRSVLTTLRGNTLAGYTVPLYPLVTDDLLNSPQNKRSEEEKTDKYTEGFLDAISVAYNH